MLELDKRPSFSRLEERRVLFTQCAPDPQQAPDVDTAPPTKDTVKNA